MRLWHYKLIPYLPKSQLLAQWRELNSIFVSQNKHILINYVYEYPKLNLWYYTKLVTNEMFNRGFRLSKRSMQNADRYFGDICASLDETLEFTDPFDNHHTNGYLKQCFYNLQEKYDRGQKDFTKEMMVRLEKFVKEELGKDVMPNGEL